MVKFAETKIAKLIKKYFPKYYYKRIIFDGHYIYWPRWGHTKEEIESAEKRAKELYESILWEEPEDGRLTEPMDTETEEFKEFQNIIKMKKEKDGL